VQGLVVEDSRDDGWGFETSDQTLPLYATLVAVTDP
jgi:hypothetical protein